MAKKVLIVDDDPLTINLLQLILELAGFQTAAAENGAEALRAVAVEQPDVVLLDVMMPTMDGFAVCRKLRNQPETAGLPIIILSTDVQARSLDKGMRAGATKYLFKPISRHKLVAEVHKAIKSTSPSLHL